MININKYIEHIHQILYKSTKMLKQILFYYRWITYSPRHPSVTVFHLSIVTSVRCGDYVRTWYTYHLCLYDVIVFFQKLIQNIY